jgi:uncharacterized delta-60 repeat protein
MKSRLCLVAFLAALAFATSVFGQETWQPRVSGVTVPLWSVAYGDGQWVAVGEQGTILTSADGQTWTPRSSGFPSRWLVGVGYGTPGGIGLWVAVGEAGLILTSPDGATWTARRTAGIRINAVAWGNGTFVAADDAGSTYFSIDGITWNGAFFGARSTFVRGLAYGTPHFVTTGLVGINTTYEGTSSTQRVASAPQLQGAAYGRRLFLATGGANTYTSRDAINWTQQPATTAIGVQGATFFNNQFLAVGNNGAIATTFDGSVWTERMSGTTQTLLAVAGAPDSAVAVGFGGTILQSAPALAAPTVSVSPSAPYEAVGGNVALIATARGSEPLIYQWRKDGVEIPGATADTLFLANVQLAQSGAYTCVVTNPVASASSTASNLTVVTSFPAADPLDPTFSLSAAFNVSPRVIATQSDGKYLVGGNFLLLNEGQAQFGLARLTATGALDASFKPGAIDSSGSVQTIAVQPDGKILIGGTFASVNGVARSRIARLNSDGSLDLTFVPTAALNNNAVVQLLAVADGRVLVGNGNSSVVRLNADGSLDATWTQTPIAIGLNGTNTVFGTVRLFDLQPDGKVVVGATGFVGSSTSAFVRRLNADGTNDPAFPLVTLGNASSFVALRALSDGRIMAAASGSLAIVQRLTPTGTADSTFSPINSTGLPLVAASFTADGRSWLAGSFTTVNGASRNQLARLLVDGGIDPAYNPGTGVATTGGLTTTASAIQALDDGRALIVGDFGRINGIARIQIARLNAQSPGGVNGPAIFALDSYYREVRAGEPFAVQVSATGSAPLTYGGTYSGGSFNGVTTATVPFPTLAATNSGPIAINASNGNAVSPAQTFYVRVLPSAPFIVQQPVALQSNSGRIVSLSVTSGGSSGLSYQWFKNGNAIATGVQATFTLGAANPADSGDYTVVVRNNLGFATSQTVHLGIDETPRFVNIATRALAGRSDSPLIAGFVVAGPGAKRVMVRAVGPTLGSSFNLPGFLPDPVLSVYNAAGTLVYANDDWSSANDVPGLASAGTRLGAFTLGAASADAGGILTLSPGSYTAVVTGKNNATGLALVEVYEDDNVSSRLVNLSSRAFVGTGGSVAIPGIVVRGGTTPKKLLVRAVGPGLTAFGVSSVLTNPIVTITNSAGVDVATNDDWETNANVADLRAATNKVTFPLAIGSKDAALLVTLPPGGYTVQVSGVADATGNALVEVYEVP